MSVMIKFNTEISARKACRQGYYTKGFEMKCQKLLGEKSRLVQGDRSKKETDRAIAKER